MTKMKGLFKSIKNISQIFVVQKEQEMEIGYPTDVKHVAHIGWENSESMNSPSWINNFKSGTEFTSNSPTKFGQSMFKDPTCTFQDYNVTDTPKASKVKKKKKKLNKSSSLNKSTM